VQDPKVGRKRGNRTHRGQYVTSLGFHISADAQGSCNIMKKVAAAIGISLENITVSCCQFLDRIYLWKRSKEQKTSPHVKAPQLACSPGSGLNTLINIESAHRRRSQGAVVQ
jgi:hypothetical protein